MGAKPNNHRQAERELSGIAALSVAGFKSICDECHLEVRPLTILAGANSSGKSSAIQPFLLLKQTLEQSYDPGPLLLDGGNVRFTAVDQLLSRIPGNRAAKGLRVSIVLDAEGRPSLSLVFQKRAKGGIAIQEVTSTGRRHHVTLRPGMSHEEIDAQLPGRLAQLEESRPDRESTHSQWVVTRNRCFLEAGIAVSAKERPTGFPAYLPLFLPHVPFDRALRAIVHVPGLRVTPSRAYKTSGTGPHFPGTFENYIASLIYEWQTQGDPRLEQLGAALGGLGLAWRVVARRLDDTRIELLVPRSFSRPKRAPDDLVNIADVGLGVPQVLPALVALIQARPGQTVYLEEPEIHLHPRAQRELPGLLADGAKRGVRVLAETHSALLLLGIQTLVAEGKLSPDLVKLHWFTRDKQGATKVTSADLDEAGTFGDWPEDFGDVDLEVQSRYLDAADRRRAGV